MLRKSLLPTFTGIAPGEKAQCDLILGRRYHVIWLEFGDTTAGATNASTAFATALAGGNPDTIAAAFLAMLPLFCGDINVLIDSGLQREHSLVELNALNMLNNSVGLSTYSIKTSGTAGTADFRVYVPILLAELFRKDTTDVGRGAWNAVGIKELQITCQLGTALAPVVRGWCEWEPPNTKMGIDLIAKWVRQNVAVVGTEQDVPISRRDNIQSVHFFPVAAAYVNSVKLTANGELIVDELTTLENQAGLLARDISPDTSAAPRYDLIFDATDKINDALPSDNLAELNAKIKRSADTAGNMTLLIQRVGPPA